MNEPKKLSAIICLYRDAQAIPFMHERLTKTFQKIGVDYEIIFVNDCSPDDTEEVLRKLSLADPHVIGVNHARNFGAQMAFTSGMDLSTGDAIFFLDGDMQDPPEVIEEFYKKWMEGYEVVYGIRAKREAPWFMQIGYKMFYRVFANMSYIKIPLDAGEFSLIDRRVVEELKKFPERDRLMRGLRAWVGFKQIGVPFDRPERMFGKSNHNLLKNFRWAMLGIFSFSYKPVYNFTLFSIGVSLLAAVGIVAQVVLQIVFHKMNWHLSILVILVLFFGAAILMGISILGEYIAKIFEEVKGRPKYIVKSVFRQN
jgi:dolichol-phosphate mannosyltransferase